MSNTKKPTASKAEATPADEPAPADTAAAPEDTAAEDTRDAEIAELEAQLLAASVPAPPVDPRDAYIAELKAKLAAVEAPVSNAPVDPRDLAIAALKAEVEQLRSTPEGEANELRRALASLADTVNRMQTGQGLVPHAESADAPAPYLYGGVLGCGDIAEFQHPTATAHYCADHGTVPVRSWFTLSPDMIRASKELANAR